MQEMSCEIDRLEAELRRATQKATRHEGQAEAYKQKAESYKQEAEAHKQELVRSAECWAVRDSMRMYELIDRMNRERILAANAHKQEAEAHKQEADALAQKLEALECEAKICTVCLEHPADVVAVPCGHSCFCTNAECSAHVSWCPLCRESMSGKLRIF